VNLSIGVFLSGDLPGWFPWEGVGARVNVSAHLPRIGGSLWCGVWVCGVHVSAAEVMVSLYEGG